jgi:nitroimidazol reductase NimA-like FMN-containing flavoprotein (pyridoxamine 5'-phosphate oxidase superfamily)
MLILHREIKNRQERLIAVTNVKLPKMTEQEIEDLIREQMLCRIAFKGSTYPYMAPFQYVVVDGSLYFHFTDYGKKMHLIEQDDRVCVEIESYQPNLSKYNFVVLRGRVAKVTAAEERAMAITKLAEEGKRRVSTKFLVAHGFKESEGWSAFSPEKALVILKLEEIVETVGLKSPP